MASWKIAPAILIALILASAAACSGGTKEAAPDKEATPRADLPVDKRLTDPYEPLVSIATETLGKSVEAFEEGVQSVRMEMVFNSWSGGEAQASVAEMWAKEPNQFYMTVEVPENDFVPDIGDTFEILLVDDKLYMTDIVFGSGGPFYMDFSDHSADDPVVEQTFADEFLLDYPRLVEEFGDDVEDLGEESIDGGTFRHFRVTIDLSDCVDALSQSVVQPEVLGGELPSPTQIWEEDHELEMDVWVYPETSLPHKIETGWEFEHDGETAGFEMSISFFDYNEEFDLPEPPANARSFESVVDDWLKEIQDPETFDGVVTGGGTLEVAGPLRVRDLNFDGVIDGEDEIAVELRVAAGSPPFSMQDIFASDVVKYVDAEGRLDVTEVGITPIYGNGNDLMEPGERFEFTFKMPGEAVLSPNETFTIEVSPAESGVLLISRTMPPEISPEIVLN